MSGVRYRAQVALYLLGVLVRTIYAQNDCQSESTRLFKIPVRNVSLANNALRRGLPVSVGTPPQRFAFIPDPNKANNSYVYSIGGDQCASDNTPIQCEAFHSGQFDKFASSTWLGASSPLAAGAAVSDSEPRDGDVFGTDTVQLNTSTTFTKFPVGIENGNNLGDNVLGLATNSTLLNAMMNARLIASRTWSLFWGLTGSDERSQMDGILLLGGYDLAKTKGSNSTQSMATGQACSLFVTITNMKMNFPNNTDFEILATQYSTGLRMCVAPQYPIITIPYDVWSNFAAYAGGTYIGRSFGIYGYGELYQAAGVYGGDLTLTLDSGLQIRIPNSQLVKPEVSISSSGQQFINDTTREVSLNSLQDINAKDVPLLGQTFLTSAYLYVDNDKAEFTIWQANATTEENIIAVGPSATCTTPVSVASATASASDPPLPSNSPQPSSVPVGAIAGAAVGCVLLLLLIGLASFYVRRRKRRATQTEASEALPPVPLKELQMQDSTRVYLPVQELPADKKPQELAGGGNQRHELG